MYDSYQYAGGMKVCNLLRAWAYNKDILVTMNRLEEAEKGQYPGAWVFPPKGGFNRRRPRICFDFKSLYPNLMRTYNLSLDKIIFLEEEYEKYLREGKSLHEINFKYKDRIIKAWTIRHGNNREEMGLYVIVLEYLLNERIKIRKKMEGLDKKSFEYRCLDNSQLAVKILANSFYGELGNPLSPFFELALAGAVTTAGRYNIKKVANFIQQKGYKLIYGDTDSVYVEIPENLYEEIDKLYNENKITKLEYWEKMVEISIKNANEIKKEINEYIRNDNGSPFLEVAFEESIFPSFFAGKKKYFGLAHIKKPNFKLPRHKNNTDLKYMLKIIINNESIKFQEIFIRGIDVIKKGTSEFFRDIGNEIM